MIQFIKKAVAEVVPTYQEEFYNGTVCIVLCYIMSNKNFATYDVKKIANNVKLALIEEQSIYGKELSECTVSDYSELYSIIFGGNNILFLKIYQDHIGKIN